MRVLCAYPLCAARVRAEGPGPWLCAEHAEGRAVRLGVGRAEALKQIEGVGDESRGSIPDERGRLSRNGGTPMIALAAITGAAVAIAIVVTSGSADRTCAGAYIEDGMATVRLLDAEARNAVWRSQQTDNRLDGDPAWVALAGDYQRALAFASDALGACTGTIGD